MPAINPLSTSTLSGITPVNLLSGSFALPVEKVINSSDSLERKKLTGADENNAHELAYSAYSNKKIREKRETIFVDRKKINEIMGNPNKFNCNLANYLAMKLHHIADAIHSKIDLKEKLEHFYASDECKNIRAHKTGRYKHRTKL